MDEKNREELISAYLDGELDAAENERTVKWIAEDPRAQQMLQELQSLQEALRELPRHRLEKNLTQPILEQINVQSEEAVFSMTAADLQPEEVLCAMTPASISLSEPSAISHPSSEIEKPLAHDRRRLYLWPAVAIAAAVFLMFFSSREPTEKEQVVVRTDQIAPQDSATDPVPTIGLPSSGVIESVPRQSRLRSAKPRAQHRIPQVKANNFGGSVLAESVAPAAELEGVREFSAPLVNADKGSRPSAPDTEQLLPTYFFNVSPEVDIKNDLDEVVRGVGEVKMIDLGTAYQDTRFSENRTPYHIYELHGRSDAIHTATKALKKLKGITLYTGKTLRSEDFKSGIAKGKHSKQITPRRDKTGALPSRVQLIFILPASQAQPPKR